MKQPNTHTSYSETQLVVLYLAKKMGLLALRWFFYLSMGVLAWVLFDPLPPIFFWLVLVTILGAMSIHSVLHHRSRTSSLAKQVCRYAFFLSFPLLFLFIGNRMAVWAVSDQTAAINNQADIQKAQGAIATEEYLLLKEIQKEGIKDPTKAKKKLKKIFGKQLKKFKEMDKNTRIILIILGVVLLLIIVFLIAVVYAVNDSVNGCLEFSGSSNSSSESCCM